MAGPPRFCGAASGTSRNGCSLPVPAQGVRQKTAAGMTNSPTRSGGPERRGTQRYTIFT